jgi:hypothetical protein
MCNVVPQRRQHTTCMFIGSPPSSSCGTTTARNRAASLMATPSRPYRFLDLVTNSLERDAERLQCLGAGAIPFADQPEQDVLSADQGVIELARLFLCDGQHPPCPVGKAFEHSVEATPRGLSFRQLVADSAPLRHQPGVRRAQSKIRVPSHAGVRFARSPHAAPSPPSAWRARHAQPDHGDDVALYLVRPTSERENGLAPRLILQAPAQDSSG